MKKIFTLLSILFAFIIPSCKKFADIPLPPDQLNTEFVFTNDSAAMQSITGIYSEMMNSSAQFSSGYTSFYAGMAADELYYFTPSIRDEFTANDITLASHSVIETSFWSPMYRYIYAANLAIEGITASTLVSTATKNMVLGEAKLIRAFCYFHLVNLFGNVPLILSTSYQINQSAPRTALSVVYNQVINDLKDAANLLSAVYPGNDKARPNKFAATAMLAKVYLYTGDWHNSELASTDIINSGLYSLVSNLNNVFLANSAEAIWQFRPVSPSRNTWEGNTIIPASTSVIPTFVVTPALYNGFTSLDARKTAWLKSATIGSQTVYYPFKYKVRTGTTITENYMVLRLADMYLVRSEARARQNDLIRSTSDLDKVRQRAMLPLISVINPLISQTDLLLLIEKERQLELFCEWGNRWFDLKRTGRADVVLQPLKPGTWQSTDLLWPLPESQLNLNSALYQNPGY